MLDVLNRPALLLLAFVAATLVGFALGRTRGAVRAALAAVAAWGVLVAAKAAEWMPDAAGWLATGIAVAVAAGALALWLPRPKEDAA